MVARLFNVLFTSHIATRARVRVCKEYREHKKCVPVPLFTPLVTQQLVRLCILSKYFFSSLGKGFKFVLLNVYSIRFASKSFQLFITTMIDQSILIHPAPGNDVACPNSTSQPFPQIHSYWKKTAKQLIAGK